MGHAYRSQRGFSVFSGACLFWKMEFARLRAEKLLDFAPFAALETDFASTRGAKPHEVVTRADPFLGCFFD